MKNQKRTDLAAIVAAALLAVALLAVGVFAQSAAFRFFGPLSRVITPNGDFRNDLAVFCFDNPADSEATGKIYTLLGSEVAAIGPRAVAQPTAMPGCNQAGALPNSVQFATWDGRSNGSVVPSGIYIYRVTAELKAYSGTLIVVR